MHARHRSPGNGGYRSTSMGMGVAPSRISPETSATTTRGNNHGFYNPEYHRNNFKRGGFGRGKTYSKPNHSPAPPRKGSNDIFMEAGKLAAQYLGMLAPPTGKWQGSNNNNNKQLGEFQDGEDARPSALARLGTSDTLVIRRRYSDDYNNSTGPSKFSLKGRKRENFQSERSDWGRENGEPWLDGTRSAPHAEEDNDSTAFERSEDPSNGLQKSESAPKGEEAGDSESELEKHNLQNEMEHSKKLGSSNDVKELQRDSGVEDSKKSDDAATDSNGERVELGDGNISVDNEVKGSSTTEEQLSTEHCSAVGEPLCKNPDDLLAVCKFGNVPTKKRSSLKPKKEDESASDIGEPRRYVEDDSLGGSSADFLPQKSHDLKFLDSEASKELPVPPPESVGGLDYTYGGIEQVRCKRSQSFPDRAVWQDSEEGLGLGIPGLPRSSSMVSDKGEKRALEQSDVEEVTKKRREWLQPMATMTDDFSNLSDTVEKKGVSEEGSDLPSESIGMTIDQSCFVKNSQLSEGDGSGSSPKHAEEKQLFPSSFRICDLNLMQADERHQSYPKTLKTNTEAALIGIDLSMNNSAEGSRNKNSSKEIEVIDLEDDSAQEVKAVNIPETKNDAMFEGMNGDIADVPDQYDGLTLTEFFKNFSSSPHVPEDINPHYLQNDSIDPLQHEDINPLQSGMGLPNEEGTLGDDDSIYMSLGEIPLSFLPAWEQQASPREYEKPF